MRDFNKLVSMLSIRCWWNDTTLYRVYRYRGENEVRLGTDGFTIWVFNVRTGLRQALQSLNDNFDYA